MDATGSLDVRWIQGFTNKRVEFVDNETVCYTCGSHICFLNLETKTQSVFQSPGRGIGALTANGHSGVFAFSEQNLSPSIFVYSFPEFQLKNELKGAAQLDYTSLTLSDGGPYLGCCSSLPDHTITVWNWENAEPVCKQPQAGHGVVSLVFNPLNWLQLCALGTTSLTIWSIEKSGSNHVLKPSVIELPAADGSLDEGLVATSHTVSTYFTPKMPPSAISGFKGNKAGNIVTKASTKARLTPTAICWRAESELYVGCAEGFLLLVDTESLHVTVLFDPKTAVASPELGQSNFQSLTLDKNGLIAVGKESVLCCLQIKGSQIDIKQTWQLEGPVATVMHSPDFETLLLSSNTGQIYILHPTQSDKIVKVLDISSGNFVAAALSHTDKNICVSLRDSGELQLWSADGIGLGSLSLQTEVRSLACCPIAQYAAVGTASGNVLFIDLNKEEQPRLVHQVHLCHTPVDHLVFDAEGHYLLTGGSDSHIYVLNAQPSNMFSVIGYTVVPGPILSLSAQCIRNCEQVKVLALCAGQDGKNQDGNLLVVLSLPMRDLAGPDCVDRHGCLSAHILKVVTYQVPHPLNSSVLGISDVFAYCHKRKTLQRFRLPQDADGPSSQEAVQLEPEQEVGGHPLGPASLTLSAHHLWLASVGRDGLLSMRETASMERHIELQCHSCRAGGVGSVSFSADSQTLVTAGFEDGSLVCTSLRFEGVDDAKVNEATRYSQCLDHFLRNVFSRENTILTDLPEWDQRSPAGTEKTEESEVTKRESEQYFKTKQNLPKTIKDLRDTIQEMMHENESLPDTERLDQQEYNLDAEQQRRMQAMMEQDKTRIKNEIEWEISARCYLFDALKGDYWDNVKVKGLAIKAFHSEHEVRNYPLKERSEKQVDVLLRIQAMRTFEKAACTLQQNRLRNILNTNSEKEKEQREEGHEAESAAATGSVSAQLGYSNPHIYDQLSLQTREQKINQIILLQDVIHRIKTAFNADFEAVHRQKTLELNHVRERNRHIRDIMLKLDMSKKLWESSLTSSECPETLLRVDDSEIKAEKYLTPEQKRGEERTLEEQSHSAAKGEYIRERALDDMMSGVLEVKKEDILKVEIPPPEFVLTKADIHWSEEEKKAYKEYEKKSKDLIEEKEKYKKSLESEIKNLQTTTKNATERFDVTLRKLFEKKVKCEMAIHQERLKMTYLINSVVIEEEMRKQEMELKLKFERIVAFKDETAEEVKRHEEEVELFHENYDSIVAEDKFLDKDFRKEFFDIPSLVVDQLYKLFKRRPSVQKLRAQTDNNPNLPQEQRLCGSQPPSALVKMLKAMEDLDAPENMPKSLNPSTWERFCLVRRAKVESEQQIKIQAVTLAEMQANLQRMRDEDEAIQQEMERFSDELESLHEERNRLLMDITAQFLLKNDRVEVSTSDMTANYMDSVLHHKSVVEDLNSAIRRLGEQKITFMVKHQDSSKSIRRLQLRLMQKEAQEKALSSHKSQLTKHYLKKKHEDMMKQESTVTETLDFHEQCHARSEQHHIANIEQLNRQALKEVRKEDVGEQALPAILVTVSERRHICEAIPSVEYPNEKYDQDIVLRRNLEDFAKAQEEELVLLLRELVSLWTKTIPIFDF